MNVSNFGRLGRLWQTLLIVSEAAVAIHYRTPWAPPGNTSVAPPARAAARQSYRVACRA